jgi:hypothetical protein
MMCSLETQSMALQAAAKLHNFIINTDGVPSGQPLQLNANNQLDPAQVAANGILHCQMEWVQTDSLQLISMPKKDHPAVETPSSQISPTRRRSSGRMLLLKL